MASLVKQEIARIVPTRASRLLTPLGRNTIRETSGNNNRRRKHQFGRIFHNILILYLFIDAKSTILLPKKILKKVKRHKGGGRGTAKQRLRDFETSRLQDFETSRHRDFKTSRLRDFETSRLRDIETSRLQDFETSRLRDFKTSRLRDFETSRLQDFETSRLQDIETSRLRDFETSRLQDFETSRLRDIKTSRHRDPLSSARKADNRESGETVCRALPDQCDGTAHTAQGVGHGLAVVAHIHIGSLRT